jgi:hypothetical protein
MRKVMARGPKLAIASRHVSDGVAMPSEQSWSLVGKRMGRHRYYQAQER